SEDGELHRQDVAGLAARIIGRRLVYRRHFTGRKSSGVEARRVKSILVKPEADRVFCFHLPKSPFAVRSGWRTFSHRFEDVVARPRRPAFRDWGNRNSCNILNRTLAICDVETP